LNNNAVVKAVCHYYDPCGSEPSVTSNLIKIKVNEITPSVRISASATSVCFGSSVTFTAEPTNPGSAPTFKWQVNGNYEVNSNTSNPASFTTPSLTNRSRINVIMTSNIACAYPATVSSDDAVVDVVSGPTPKATITASSTNICLDSSVTFTASIINGGSLPSYLWQINGTSTGTNSSTFVTSSLKNNDLVNCKITSNANCVSTATVNSNTITMKVNNIVAPSVTITASETHICTGKNVIFTATAVNGGTSPTFAWIKNGSSVGASSSTYSNNNLKNGDQISVVMASNAVCVNPSTATATPVKLTVQSFTPSITITGDTLVDEGTAVIISSNSTSSGTTPVYRWQDSTSTHTWKEIAGAGQTAISYTPGETGDRIRCLLISNIPCATINQVASNSLPFIVNITNGIRTYPNPVNTTLIIDHLLLSGEWETVEISNGVGTQSIVKNITGQTKISIDVRSLTSGIYFATFIRKQGFPVHLTFVKL